ncbi:hypothetical protein GCM10010191_29210 [Actinomadura vinacea]|uniref:Uncharacterized protein n=1 Tax=Actinomadura vinacea TaxID=115336 RepID=A0ABN3IXS5_9ACTN
MDAEYRELVRLAYFILPGKGKRTYRLALARRIVDRAGGHALGFGLGRHRGRAWRRTRVLRHAMRPRRRWQIGLRPWLRSMPARLPDPSLTAMLSTLEPRIRVAYVLLYVAELPRFAVRDQLVALRVRDPWLVIEAAEERAREAARKASRRTGGRGAAAERAAVPEQNALPPGTPRRAAGPRAGSSKGGGDPFAPPRPRPARGRTPIPIGVAVALTAVLAGALVVSETGGAGRFPGGTSSADAQNPPLVSAAPDAWRRAPRSLDVWPARGDLAGDRAFTARASRAWAAAAKAGRVAPGGDPQLLFAGRVDGRPVALLRHGDRVGRFTGADGRLAVSTAGTDPSAPIAAGDGRYLLAPWDGAETLTGAEMAVREGLTEPVRPRSRCGRGPLLHLTSDGDTRTVGEFGGARPAVLVHRSPEHTVPAPGKPGKKRAPAKPATPARLKGAALGVWERVACLTPQEARPIAEAMAWEFWSGTLPRGGGRAQWVCTGMTLAGGGGPASGQSVLLDRKGAYGTGACDTRRPVAGAWRRSAQGEWHYLAASARGLEPQAKGPFVTSAVNSRLLHATPSGPKRRPSGPVTLTARPPS